MEADEDENSVWVESEVRKVEGIAQPPPESRVVSNRGRGRERMEMRGNKACVNMSI